jgi:hypothetical protein
MNDTYIIGKRDAIAEILMAVRLSDGDTNKVIRELAELLKDNPHAQWVIENL